MPIVETEGVLSGKPRLEGRRISVIQIAELVLDHGEQSLNHTFIRQSDVSVSMSIVSDEDVRSGTPRIEGTRITVLDVKRRVIDGGEDPHVVAGEYEISMAELFRALAHYYDHREQFESEERTYASARRAGEQRIQEKLAELAESGERAD